MILNAVVKKGGGIDTSQDTVTPEVLLSPYTAHNAEGNSITGTMVNKGAVTGTISTKAGQYTIPAGYHNGKGKVGISSTEKNKIIASNIKSGVTILGVTGTGAIVNSASAQVTIDTWPGAGGEFYYYDAAGIYQTRDLEDLDDPDNNWDIVVTVRSPSILVIDESSSTYSDDSRWLTTSGKVSAMFQTASEDGNTLTCYEVTGNGTITYRD